MIGYQRASARLGLVLCLLSSVEAQETFFTDVTDEAMRSPMIAARGVALGDYDNDGWTDMFQAEGLFGLSAFNSASVHRIALIHNEGKRFAAQNQLIQAPVPDIHKGAGSIFGDYDNDGDLDLFIPMGSYIGTNRVRNVLLRNDRGVFSEVTAEAGLHEQEPSNSAIWFDYDLDGHLDLYVGNWSNHHTRNWQDLETPNLTNTLYRNSGDGTFVDVTEEAGLYEQWSSAGGSDGATVAADFNDDGWPDLYLGVGQAPNRLFLNDQQGGFTELVSVAVADTGQANGVAVGDIDNDGHLDLFQTAGGDDGTGSDGVLVGFRSVMLLNLGAGNMLQINEGAGLTDLGKQALGAAFGDLDNDGDLDLLLGVYEGDPLRKGIRLYLNDGTGVFTDGSSRSGIRLPTDLIDPFVDRVWGVGLVDYDNDGFLDAMVGHSGGSSVAPWGKGLFRNNGNDNHYLRVELVGVESNRTGIGARLIATAGGLRQMREILGGLGRYQNEMVAHFGLGGRIQVDRLEIRWPSGQVDVLSDIPTDQKIRVIEGREAYHTVRPSVWEAGAPPESVVAGTSIDLKATLRPALFEEGAQITRVTADLSAFGGPEAVELAAAGAGSFRLETELMVDGLNGLRILPVLIEQSTSLGPYWTRLSRTVAVLPSADLTVFTDEGTGNWALSTTTTLAEINLSNHPDNDGFPSWSPDGTRIAFVSDRDGPNEVYVMGADGSNPINLSNHPAIDDHPSWSPDGTRIAFFSNRDGNAEIYVMGADGSNPVNLSNHPNTDSRPSWSPDGTQIAFFSNRDGNAEIYVMGADGSNQVNLSESPSRALNFAAPSWSPDGTNIAFGSWRDGNLEIFVKEVTGGINAVELDPEEDGVVYRGETSLAVRANGRWSLAYAPAVPAGNLGYGSLHFAFHPGDVRAAAGDFVRVAVDQLLGLQGGEGAGNTSSPVRGEPVEMIGGGLEGAAVDLEVREWQMVEIPLAVFDLKGPIARIRFTGDLEGTFYLDDIRLVAATPPSITAVTESYDISTPESFTVHQNYPNPFNPETTIRFDLPSTADVDLSLYNLAGQRVATLAVGLREAGSYSLRWDGRDDAGRDLASGMYFYRLTAGNQVETRKLLLLR